MNINKEFYNMIYKRKSFHLFRNIGEESISEAELKHIEEAYKTLIPLCPDIKTAIRFVPANKVSFYNRIDIGIFLCFLEVCLKHNGIGYEVELFEDKDAEEERVPVAVYKID